ncbi:TadE/TadG family protein [Pseudohoeflea suaedae]|uniref:TadE/TadG family protein n=1 Tax=Pseudohoeflea suaedae TaxID=877384 RepID=A0A4R5PPM0_9HYPH|nr:TadE/TadG family type IV pilus assembly protein [Pseudohoeflea suaedae]TDH38813.1 TadE/TadG family protein [Pseudohoeflea suaedae]
MFLRRLAHTVRSFVAKEDGNFAIVASLAIPMTFAAGSLAVDFASMTSMKTRLQNAVDGAALATANQLAKKTITQDNAQQYALNFFNGMIAGDSQAYNGFTASPTATVTPIANGPSTIWKVEVKSTGTQQLTPMAHVVGHDSITIKVSGTSEATVDATTPLSMFLVLDRSGSMGQSSGQQVNPNETCKKFLNFYTCKTYTKLDILKAAVSDLVDHIKSSDPENKYSRMGAIAYNTKSLAADMLVADWNKDRITTFTNQLVADDGTNSSAAMKWARQQMVNDKNTEENAHLAMNGSNKPEKFIVFMTDGQNETGSDWGDDDVDRRTKQYCNEAKAAGVTIFSVAFQAPLRGEQLLEACASGMEYYYDADSADALIQAFKEIGAKATKMSTRLVM